MEHEQLDRLIGAIRAQGFVLRVLTAHALSGDSDPAAGAKALKALMGDQFADAVPAGKMDPEREARINHYSAHFAEQHWAAVEEMFRRRGEAPR